MRRAPLKAQDRIAARYIPEGFTVYKQENDGIVYSGFRDTPIKGKMLGAIAYRGSAINAEWNYLFTNDDDLKRQSDLFFERCAEIVKWRESRRANRTKGETDTQKVKAALKAARFNVTSVHRGSGTASNWIEITIDDYDQYIDKNGYKQRHYGEVMRIAQIASGREHLEDDIQTDLFMVNINVQFTKYHKCSECIISNCEEWHTPDSCARGCFYSKEMAAADEIKREKWRLEDEQKQKGIVAVPAPDNQVDLINTVVNCGAIITIPQSQYAELKEQGKTNSHIFDLVGSEPVKKQPAGYVPYLNLSIVEETI